MSKKQKKQDSEPIEKYEKPIVLPKESRIRFEDYCTVKKVLPRHRAGMEVFARKKGVYLATLPDWNALFENY